MLYTLHFYSKIPKSLFKILLIQSYYMYSAFYTHVTAVMLQAAVQDSTIFPLGLKELCKARHSFAKSTQEVASIYPDVEPIDATSCIVLRIHVWLRKAFEPERQIVDCWTAGWRPSAAQLYSRTRQLCSHLPTANIFR